MQHVELAYGKHGLKAVLPSEARAHIIRKPALPIPDNPTAVIDEALDCPIASDKLEVIARGAKTACILICDITRPVPNGLFLRRIIERLGVGGISPDGVTVLVATGLHRPNLGDELVELVGDSWVLDAVHVANHDARNDEQHVDLGFTDGHRTPVLLDRRFVEADVKIVTGLVEPHFMAGWSGGRKVIAPGVAHHSTIRTFHSARFMEHEAARSCNLLKNPLHEEQIEIVRMLGGKILALNTVIDEARNLVFATFGDIEASHDSAVAFAKDATAIPVNRRFKTVLTSAAGYPLDKTYYQTVKGMVTPIDILEPGGNLIIVSECSEGIGSSEFRAAQERLVNLGMEAFLASLTGKRFAAIDEWQTEMQLKPMRVGRVGLYAPLLDPVDQAVTGVNQIDDLTDAIATSIATHNDIDIAVIPEGPYLVPYYASGS
ncbi:MAG: nickel-dependent lactate racemase [Hyphomicrobiaceae bacterium]